MGESTIWGLELSSESTRYFASAHKKLREAMT
jgi:hypothetical protein